MFFSPVIIVAALYCAVQVRGFSSVTTKYGFLSRKRDTLTSKARYLFRSSYLEYLNDQPPAEEESFTRAVVIEPSPFNEERTATGTFIDSTARLEKSTFVIPPNELIEMAKSALRGKVGLSDESSLADDFEFCAPYLGPITKTEYIDALKTFHVEDAFPDIDNQVFNIHVDPFKFNRVWFMVYPKATHSGSLFGKKPTGKQLQLPPQCNSLTFNERGQVTQLTAGYVVDRRVGNTGGLGGVFGLFYGVGQGLPIPECKPYKRSWQFRLLNIVGRFGAGFKRVGKTRSN